MNDELFNELLDSVREGGRILHGEVEAAHRNRVGTLDVRFIRESFGMSRAKFATLLGISERTLEGWEQGRRKPRGPARMLLEVAARHPDAVLDTVRQTT